MSKSSSLVFPKTKGNVTKLCYILSGVGSRVIVGEAEVGCYESNRGCVMEKGEM